MLSYQTIQMLNAIKEICFNIYTVLSCFFLNFISYCCIRYSTFFIVCFFVTTNVNLTLYLNCERNSNLKLILSETVFNKRNNNNLCTHTEYVLCWVRFASYSRFE